MILNQATLDGLRSQFSLRFDQAFAEAPVNYPKLVTEVQSTSETTKYGWIATALNMREWVGARVARNLSEHDYSLQNKKFELTIEIDRDQIEDDNLGMYTGIVIPQLAQAARQHPDQLLAELIQSNPKAFDGKALFAADHPTFNGSGTYDNDHALALTADNFFTVWADMTSYTGEDGAPLGVMPNALIIPPQLRKAALEAVEAATVNGGDTNVLKGWVDVIVLPRLANNPDRWFLADLSKPLKPFIYQVRRAPEFVSRDSLTDPRVFEQEKFLYGVSSRGAMGVTLPFLISRSDPTP